jgi:VWFA-related protein
MRIAFLMLLFSLCGAPAQEQSGETFKSGVTMIQVPVVVRDRDGHAVSNLEKDDFQLFDNGKRVEIASFAVEKPGSQAIPDRSLPDPSASAPAKPGPAMDIPERFIAYYFDDRSIRGIADLTRIRTAAAQQLGALQPGDRAAIFTSSCHVTLDFTNDRAQLQATVSRLELAPPPMCRVSQAQVLQVEVLKDVVRRMSNLPGRRSIILISSGFWVGHDRTREPEELIESAVRSKVVIDALDLGASTDYTGFSAGSAGGASDGGRAANPALPEVLLDLTHGTGGAYVTGNDFAVSLRKLATPESHYLLAFVPTAKADGRAHQLKVKLANAGKLKVEARSEYYAPQRAE